MRIIKIIFLVCILLFNFMMLYGESDTDSKLIVYEYGRTWEDYYVVRKEIDFYEDGLMKSMRYYTHGEKGDTYLIWTIEVIRKGNKVCKYVTEKGKKKLELYYEIKKDGKLILHILGEGDKDRDVIKCVGPKKYVYTSNGKEIMSYSFGLDDMNLYYHVLGEKFRYHFDKDKRLYLIDQDSESPHYDIKIDENGRYILYRRDSDGLFLDYLEIVVPKINIKPEVAIQNVILLPEEGKEYLMPFVIGYH